MLTLHFFRSVLSRRGPLRSFRSLAQLFHCSFFLSRQSLLSKPPTAKDVRSRSCLLGGELARDLVDVGETHFPPSKPSPVFCRTIAARFLESLYGVHGGTGGTRSEKVVAGRVSISSESFFWHWHSRLEFVGPTLIQSPAIVSCRYDPTARSPSSSSMRSFPTSTKSSSDFEFLLFLHVDDSQRPPHSIKLQQT